MKNLVIPTLLKEVVPDSGRRLTRLAAGGLALALTAGGASANGVLENVPWQFPTVADKWSRSLVLDQLEKMKGGYYDAARNSYNTTNTTYIDKQVNCTVTANSAGNTGTNDTTANTSSPPVTNSGATNANTAANAATSTLTQAGLRGVLDSGSGAVPSGSVDSAQSNSGTLTSGVENSNTSAATGPVYANGGTTDQILNSNQTNSGSQTASIAGSSACVGPLNAR